MFSIDIGNRVAMMNTKFISEVHLLWFYSITHLELVQAAVK